MLCEAFFKFQVKSVEMRSEDDHTLLEVPSPCELVVGPLGVQA